MQGGADADDGEQHVGECMVLIPIVQVPAFAVMVGEAGIRRSGRHVGVQSSCSIVRLGGIDDGEPAVDDLAGAGVVTWSLGELQSHAELTRSGDDAVSINRPVIGQGCREEHRVLAVRVEMHKSITSLWNA